MMVVVSKQEYRLLHVTQKSRTCYGFENFYSCISILCFVVISILSSTASAFTTTTTTTTCRITNYPLLLQKLKNLQQLDQQKKFYNRCTRVSETSKTCLKFGLDPQSIIDTLLVTSTLATAPDVTSIVLDNGNVFLAAANDAAAAANVDEGWWSSYLNIFKNGIELVHNTVNQPLRSIGIDQTWGISIALFTFAIRLALVPLSIEQSKSAEYMKALRPYTKEINEKFAKNEQAKTRAIGKLYEDANQNPLNGCLLSLIQLPIFLGLYRGVRLLAIDGELQEPFLWIPSLEGPVSAPDYRGLDWLVSGWNNGVPSLGWETTIAFMIMPVVLVLLQGITMQALQPPAMDDNISAEEKETLQRTQLVLKFLPLLIGFFSLQVPAGLTIYWFSSNIFTLTQSLLVKAYFAANPPQITLPNYWESALSGDADTMTPAERRKASEAGLSIGPTFDELIDQSKFHVYINRRNSSIRGSAAATTTTTVGSVPVEMEQWVQQSMMKYNMEIQKVQQQQQEART